MKERPILFSGPMVRAILEGRKTQTRRVIKPGWRFDTMTRSVWDYLDNGSELDMAKAVHYCPHGRRDDRLWVRETWCMKADCEEFKDSEQEYHYRAGEYDVGPPDCGLTRTGHERSPWRSPIHMPRKACRLVLSIKHVRPERLQRITAQGACKEGVEVDATPNTRWAIDNGGDYPAASYLPGGSVAKATMDDIILAYFASLWDALNKHRGFGWDENPWVWVIDFRVQERRDG